MALSPATSELQSKLRCVLGPTYHDWHAGELSIAGTGLETVVFHTWSPELGDVVFRVPWMHWISNDNEPSLDARELLAKERLRANHMAPHGVPCPRALALHRGEDDSDFLVYEYVHNDRSAIDVRALGRAIRRMHDAPVIVEPFRSHGSLSHDETLLERIRQRAKGIEQFAAVPLTLPDGAWMRRHLNLRSGCRSILHMDARPENLLTLAGNLVGIVDWSNALIGDPALELARILEYGVDPTFVQGYSTADALSAIPRELELIYRLDTAIMLAVVFFSEAPHPSRAHEQLRRVLELLTALRERSELYP
jgi:Phosphotransferase enzyme family